MEAIIFIIILLICVSIIGFLFKNIFYIAAAAIVLILLRKVYGIIKTAINKKTAEINKRKNAKEIEEMKKNINMNKTTYVDAEIVRNPVFEPEKSSEENSSVVDAEYKNL